jgi:hypothetical protein
VTASLHVFTFKAGLLSRLAHDLRFRCESFEIEVKDGKVSARFDAAALRVDGVMRKDGLDPDGLSRSDYDKIEATVRGEVLAVARHPEIRFEGELTAAGHGVIVGGQLTLAGSSAAIASTGARRVADHWQLELEIVPSRWGVAPYKALGGALKLQDRVRIQIRVPVTAEVTATSGAATWAVPARN